MANTQINVKQNKPICWHAIPDELLTTCKEMIKNVYNVSYMWKKSHLRDRKIYASFGLNNLIST